LKKAIEKQSALTSPSPDVQDGKWISDHSENRLNKNFQNIKKRVENLSSF
jgi:hypothetical protein